jgi:hypothetical protein
MRQHEFGINRRQVIRGAVAAAASTLGAPSVQAQKDQQTLRFVPHKVWGIPHSPVLSRYRV